MTEKDNFTLDNPIMYDKTNGRCRCIPIPYAKDMAERRFRVFKFPDVDKFGVSDDIVEVTVAFCDKKWEADYLCDLLNDLNKDQEEQSKCILRLVKENEKLKSTVNNLKETIIKITIAYQRKYDRTIVDLVDEVHDEDITDLIKELQE